MGDARPARPAAIVATRIGLWFVVGLGALGGIAGALRAPAVAPVSTARSAGQQVVPTEAAGFAEFVVRRWMEANGTTSGMDGLFLHASDVSGVHRWPPVVRATNVVAARVIAHDYWSVTVAVDFVAGPPPGQARTWFLEVGVVGDGHGHLAAAAEPAVVAEPHAPGPKARLEEPALIAPAPDDPVAGTVAGFLAALLTGNGQVDRYTTAGVVIDAVTPPPFTEVHVEGIASRTVESAVEVRASVRARTAEGEDRLLGYQFQLVQRDGRWEIRWVSGAPALASTTTRTAAASTAPSSRSTTSTAPVAASPGA